MHTFSGSQYSSSTYCVSGTLHSACSVAFDRSVLALPGLEIPSIKRRSDQIHNCLFKDGIWEQSRCWPLKVLFIGEIRCLQGCERESRLDKFLERYSEKEGIRIKMDIMSLGSLGQ